MLLRSRTLPDSGPGAGRTRFVLPFLVLPFLALAILVLAISGALVVTADPGAGARASKLPASTRRAELAFVLVGNTAGNGIFVARGDGSKQRTIVASDAEYDGPSWAPDGSRLVFDSDRDGDGDFDVWVADAAGTGLTNLTPTPGSDAAPVWSPRGDLIAFTSNRDGSFDLYVMRPDGTDVRNLTNAAEQISNPQWSPDGRRIVFSRDVAGVRNASDLWTVAADGSGLTKLTESGAADYFPAYAPNGRSIAFVSTRDRFPRIYRMQADGSDQQAISPPDLLANFPSWAPDSSRLAYVGQRANDEPADVFVVDRDGGKPENVSLTLDYAERVTAWSPDGKSIAATAAFEGQESIFVFRASDGADLTPIGLDSGRAIFPTWKPRPRGR